MRLQNVSVTAPLTIPLLYICQTCGAMLTIPPPTCPTLPTPFEHLDGERTTKSK